MKTKLQNKEKGFTIIEVLIVLAIAGLIVLIVFLAVPALQRNSRNTQRKNDVGAIGGALTEFVNNNNGAIPANCTGSGCVFGGNAKASLYDTSSATQFTFTNQASPTAPAAVAAVDVLKIYNNAKCNGNTPSAANATKRSIIALYAVETGGAPTPQCQEL